MRIQKWSCLIVVLLLIAGCEEKKPYKPPVPNVTGKAAMNSPTGHQRQAMQVERFTQQLIRPIDIGQ